MSSNIPMHGAVDLAALAAAREAKQRAANSPPGAAVDVTEANFKEEVIDRSLTVPVIVELRSAGSDPSNTLSPILQRLAADSAGRWVLARIDADANQRLAAAFQAPAMPSVFAVLRGQPLPLFQGALPEAQVRQVLDAVLAEAAKAGVSGTVDATQEVPQAAHPAEPPMDPDLEAAYDAMERGDWTAADAAFAALLLRNPSDEQARVGRATAALYGRVSGADPSTVLRDADAAPGDVDQQMLAADIKAANQEFADAFARLIALIRLVSGDDREVVRTRLIELFEVVGPGHPEVAKARVGLASALF
ncbi:MAG: tetratricopeptide repeat protein [Candidatus Nanopelagicales bacterium]|nr:tetratricopeptide repeat protein [Candidatus Nanopelagicales bacterium]